MNTIELRNKILAVLEQPICDEDALDETFLERRIDNALNEINKGNNDGDHYWWATDMNIESNKIYYDIHFTWKNGGTFYSEINSGEAGSKERDKFMYALQMTSVFKTKEEAIAASKSLLLNMIFKQ